MRDSMRPPAQVVRDIVKFRSSGTVLDIGAGFGRNSLHLSELGFDVTSVEPDKEMLLALREKLIGTNIKLIESTLEALPLSQTYDIVVCTMVVHFMKDQAQAHSAIKKIQELTNPCGLNCISVLLNKDVNNPRPYLFKENELSDCYAPWHILHYDEDLGLPYQPSGHGQEIRSYAARIIAENVH